LALKAFKELQVLQDLKETQEQQVKPQTSDL
jgi:hypothetical protein